MERAENIVLRQLKGEGTYFCTVPKETQLKQKNLEQQQEVL